MVSILLNLSKFTDPEFLETFANKIHTFFENDFKTSDAFEDVIKVFRVLIKSIKDINNKITTNNHNQMNFPNIKNFSSLVKFYLKRFFLIYDKDKYLQSFCLPIDYILEDFNILSNILKSNGDKNFWIDCFNFLIKQISETNTNKTGDNYLVNSLSLSTSCSLMPIQDIRFIFFEHIDKVK
jgi:hypothetical protein